MSGETQKAWRFSTDSVPEADRASVWRQMMTRLSLPVGDVTTDRPFDGEITSIISPMGIRFAVVEAEAQKIAGQFPQQPSELWLSVLLDGDAYLQFREKRIDLNVGDMIYGATGKADASLNFETRFRQIFIRAPSAILNERIVTPMSQRLGYIPAASGIRRIFSHMLTSIADEIDGIEADQLRSFDQAFMEYLIACTIDDGDISVAGRRDEPQADNLYKICQTIELLLGDPALTLSSVAEAHGVSNRFIQDCFAQNGRTFADYVKRRRLERCRNDLVSPLFAQLSVAEICYRWGFSAPAHFSRIFRMMYGVPPSEYRRLGSMGRVGATDAA
ncbi:helix-turn-helix transcriptional regulator [Hyphococcus sp. DH-69]|uniref:helix-turn-helix transcriptional regulator n=1 Tax=Hyphococcus formosus TaxID=3143534 RepID=UPI00398AEB5B